MYSRFTISFSFPVIQCKYFAHINSNLGWWTSLCWQRKQQCRDLRQWHVWQEAVEVGAERAEAENGLESDEGGQILRGWSVIELRTERIWLLFLRSHFGFCVENTLKESKKQRNQGRWSMPSSKESWHGWSPPWTMKVTRRVRFWVYSEGNVGRIWW